MKPTKDWYDKYFDTDRDLYFKIKESLVKAYKKGLIDAEISIFNSSQKK